MNLVDVMVGGLVFSLASAGSLHIYGSSLRWAQGHEQRQQVAAALDLALTEGARQLWDQIDGTSSNSHPEDCVRTAANLAASLNQVSVEQGISREVKQVGELVSITVDASGFPPRRRWFSPAAYGLCGDPPLRQLPESSPQIEGGGVP